MTRTRRTPASTTAMVVLVGMLAAAVPLQAKTWDGGDGNWSDNNWDGGDAPPVDAEEAVLPPGTYTVTLSAPTAELDAFTQYGGTLLFTNWTTALRASNVVVDAGTLTAVQGDTNAAAGNTNRVYIVCTNMTLEADGTIDVNGKGYAGTPTVGQGPGGATNTRAGGSYGGRGGRGYSGSESAGYPYGSYSEPLAPGSAGGGYSGANGGGGGGAVRIQAGGDVTLNGTITANGAGGGSNRGGGSGGGIYITCRTLNGTDGIVRANGQRGGYTTGSGGGGGRVAIHYNTNAQASVVPQPAITYSASHGSQNGYYKWDPAQEGDIGSVYFSDTALMKEYIGDNESGRVYFGSGDSLSLESLTIHDTRAPFDGEDTTHTYVTSVEFPETRELTIANDLTINNAKLVTRGCTMTVGENAVLTNYAKLAVVSAATNGVGDEWGAFVTVADRLTIAANSWVFPTSNSTNGGSPAFHVGELYVADSSAGIDADGRGFRGWYYPPGGYGPGGGGSRSGGGYGGTGGKSGGGGTYGSSNAPVQAGSGGGYQNNGVGFNGGGLVRLESAGTISLNGTIRARGHVVGGEPGGSSAYKGAGSGGGIWLKCDTFEGTANAALLASGGYGGGSGGGGGGGGRIAVWSGSVPPEDEVRILAGEFENLGGSLVMSNAPFASYPGDVSVAPGTGADDPQGTTGTVFFLEYTAFPKDTIIYVR